MFSFSQKYSEVTALLEYIFVMVVNGITHQVVLFYGGDIENMKISRVTYSSYALYEFYDCAFNFGGGSMTMDNDKNLHLNDRGYYQNFQVNECILCR
jgi:hypothetical protein